MPKYKVQIGRFRRGKQSQKPGWGDLRHARAVECAVATHPMLLVLPYQWLIVAYSSLHGYGAGKGLAIKIRLLKLESTN